MMNLKSLIFSWCIFLLSSLAYSKDYSATFLILDQSKNPLDSVQVEVMGGKTKIVRISDGEGKIYLHGLKSKEIWLKILKDDNPLYQDHFSIFKKIDLKDQTAPIEIILTKIKTRNDFIQASQPYYEDFKRNYPIDSTYKISGVDSDSLNVEASFPGGLHELRIFINCLIGYPVDAMEIGEQGTVYVTFVVEKNGEITNIEIPRGVSELLDKEAKRIISTMPNWLPGIKDGYCVRTRAMLPIIFKIN